MKQLEKYADHAYALLRIISGFLFTFHGAQKLFGLWSQYPKAEAGTQIWFGGVIEFFGGLLIMIGLQSRIAAFVCSGTMAVAYMQFHWKFQFGPAFFPIVNQGGPAVLFCFIFLYIATRGGVKWAVSPQS